MDSDVRRAFAQNNVDDLLEWDGWGDNEASIVAWLIANLLNRDAGIQDGMLPFALAPLTSFVDRGRIEHLMATVDYETTMALVAAWNGFDSPEQQTLVGIASSIGPPMLGGRLPGISSGNATAGQVVPTLAQWTARGRQFEVDVLTALRVTKNTTTYTAATGKGFIPDSLHFGLLEIKDKVRITSTPQIRAEAALATALNRPFNIVVSANNVSISRSVQRLVAATGGSIVRFDPATGFFFRWP